MPEAIINIHGRRCYISIAGEFKPGDPPPEGYIDWHIWAGVQAKAMIPQMQCSRCKLYKFMQEFVACATCKGKS